MASHNAANQKAMRNLEGSSSEPKTLDRAVRHEMNLGLCEWPTALMLTDAGEVSKGKRRDLKRMLEARKQREAATAAGEVKQNS